MTKIVTLVIGIISILYVPNNALAHGAHQEVESNSLVHLLAHGWPLLVLIACLCLFIWKRNHSA